MSSFRDEVMFNLKESVEAFSTSLASFVANTKSDTIINGIPYSQHCIQDAIFYLIEMEKCSRHLADFSIQDQQQIIFWSVQMKDEAKKVLKNEFDQIYNLMLKKEGLESS